MKKRQLVKWIAASLAIGASAFGFQAQAQSKMVLKASDVHPLGYPTVEAIVRMGKKLETATNGRISIQMFPSMQLGGEKEMIEQAQIGALQIARISVGAMGPVVDEVNVFNMPFVFRDEAHMQPRHCTRNCWPSSSRPRMRGSTPSTRACTMGSS